MVDVEWVHCETLVCWVDEGVEINFFAGGAE